MIDAYFSTLFQNNAAIEAEQFGMIILKYTEIIAHF